ncbi:MAG: peptide-methionine (S)-S-oxide reductase MsrA [Thermoguttaceae bacterium]
MHATFGGGCFWGVEHLFRQKKGVLDTACGYMGGCVPNPTYEEVCTDCTGHAEVVQVQYDPAVVSYGELLEFFWNIHDPTTLNRQGPDTGTQYRSIIFCHDMQQEKEAKEMLAKLESEKRFAKPIVTHICPAKPFYCAEEYHQKYFEKHPDTTCSIVQGEVRS